MKTAQEIIEEALKWRVEEERYDRERSTTLGKLFSNPLFPFRKDSDSGGKSSIILYLSERLSNETNEKYKAKEELDHVLRIAMRSVSIFGLEAQKEFLKEWERFSSRR